jgi:hypothetical protein
MPSGASKWLLLLLLLLLLCTASQGIGGQLVPEHPSRLAASC